MQKSIIVVLAMCVLVATLAEGHYLRDRRHGRGEVNVDQKAQVSSNTHSNTAVNQNTAVNSNLNNSGNSEVNYNYYGDGWESDGRGGRRRRERDYVRIGRGLLW